MLRPTSVLSLALTLAALACGGDSGETPPDTAAPGSEPAAPSDSSVAPSDSAADPSDPGAAPSDSSTAPSDASAPTAPSSWAYTCSDGLRFTVHFREGEAQIDLPTRGLTLPSASSGVDLVYSGSGASLRVDGREASLGLGDQEQRACTGQEAASPEDAARLLGFDFRGIGQEPGWLVDVDADRQIRWVGDYGEVRFATGAPDLEEEGETVVWRAGTGENTIQVSATEEPCNDSMSGRPFSHTVRVTVDGSEYSGCGQWLTDPASG